VCFHYHVDYLVVLFELNAIGFLLEDSPASLLSSRQACLLNRTFFAQPVVQVPRVSEGEPLYALASPQESESEIVSAHVDLRTGLLCAPQFSCTGHCADRAIHCEVHAHGSSAGNPRTKAFPTGNIYLTSAFGHDGLLMIDGLALFTAELAAYRRISPA